MVTFIWKIADGRSGFGCKPYYDFIEILFMTCLYVTFSDDKVLRRDGDSSFKWGALGHGMIIGNIDVNVEYYMGIPLGL